MKIEPVESPQDGSETNVVRSLTSTIFQSLRGAILYGHLAPGAKVGAAHLAAHYVVSLSSVREALARLAAEGLLEAEDHRGYRVARVSREDLLDLTQARLDMECMALRRAIERGDTAWQSKAAAALGALQREDAKARRSQDRRSTLHGEFHTALLEACGSQWLMRMRTMLFERAERYRLLVQKYAPARPGAEKEHDELFQAAAVERDADKACEILSRHIMATTRILLDAEAAGLLSAEPPPAKVLRARRRADAGFADTPQ